MGVIGQERLGEDPEASPAHHGFEPRHEVTPVRRRHENAAPFDPADHDVM
jgi:hypothetical protein